MTSGRLRCWRNTSARLWQHEWEREVRSPGEPRGIAPTGAADGPWQPLPWRGPEQRPLRLLNRESHPTRHPSKSWCGGLLTAKHGPYSMKLRPGPEDGAWAGASKPPQTGEASATAKRSRRLVPHPFVSAGHAGQRRSHLQSPERRSPPSFNLPTPHAQSAARRQLAHLSPIVCSVFRYGGVDQRPVLQHPVRCGLP